jgi:hypothetical protein
MNVSPQNATTSLGLSMKSPGKQSVFAIKSAKLPAIERRIPQKSRSLSAKKDMPDTAGGSPGATSLRTGHSSVGSPSPGAASHVVTAAARRQPIGASTFLLDGDDDEDNEDDEDDVDDEDKDMTDDDGPILTIHTRGSFKPLPTFQVSAASEAIPLKKKKRKGWCSRVRRIHTRCQNIRLGSRMSKVQGNTLASFMLPSNQIDCVVNV